MNDHKNCPNDNEYGDVHHPKKPLLTALLYTLCLIVVLGGAILMTKLF